MKHSFFYIAILAFTAVSCHNKSKGTASNTAEEASQTMEVIKVQNRPIQQTLKLPGELHPFESANIFAKVKGYVKEVRVDIGDKVDKGQVLMRIEAPEMQSEYAEAVSEAAAAKANYITSKDHYERIRNAAETPGTVAASDLVRAKNKMDADSTRMLAQNARVSAKRNLLGYLTITAPFSGMISVRNVDAGDFVGDNTDKAVFVIENNARLRLKIPLPEASTGNAARDSITFTVESHPGKTFHGTFYKRAHSITPETRTELWEFLVDNENGKLQAGLFAQTHVQLNRKENGIFIPNSAVLTTLKRKAVAKVLEGKIQWVDVTTGIKDASHTEVFGEVKPGDLLLINPNEELKEGLTIKTVMK
ncbi:efflux RND transporter periplasmic adaptor subunit [Muricauda sp. TY007]|uniref:efflux RND transporter periplasmic adaptor subunit n=1 Tax=Allomuricauda sp. TY007 TaxID=2683200 RepID=UPI0013C17625|nr:efflux RND transporter periplasmic adaptor subunit [Muricauda sp. TY007]NDV15734.1 efflux RND transporter periplasmic adaptor subunit [Muricauda sp. TY007]